MSKKLVDALTIGDKIMPPPREIQLWMRRTATERGLPESALQITIAKIYEGAPDKRGRWVIISGDQTPEWNAECGRPSPFTFKARPKTPWQMAD
jgi:hypothetical protein